MNKAKAVTDFLNNTLQCFQSKCGFIEQTDADVDHLKNVARAKVMAELAINISYTPALKLDWRKDESEEVSYVDAELFVVQDIDHIEYELERLISDAIAHGRELGRIEAIQAMERANAKN